MKLLQGDCLDKLKEIEPNSVDTIITDPPYGLSFMGKKWDYDVPSGEVWQECLRVLKPGGTALIFAGSRTSHRMAVRVEDAGFELKDTIMWLYGSGFPKATDISKQLDKGSGRKSIYVSDKKDDIYNSGKGNKVAGIDRTPGANLSGEPVSEEAKLWNGWKSHGLKPAYEPILVCVKPNEGTYANNALKYGVSGLNIDGGRIGTEEMPSVKIKNSYGNASGNHFGGGKPRGKEVETKAATERFPSNIILDEEAGKMLDEQSGELKSGAIKAHHNKSEVYGRNSYLKSKTILTSTTESSKGGASRFFYCAKSSKSERNKGLDSYLTVKYDNSIINNDKKLCKEENMGAVQLLEKVMFATEAVSFSIDESGGNITVQCHKGFLSTILTGINKTIELKILNSLQHFITNGFTLDANSEVKIGINPAESVEILNKWLQITTKGNQELARGVSRVALKMLSLIKEKENWKEATNFHSTVKPIKLMEYLCTLTATPTKGCVLDPFMGSGTTGVACQNTGRDFIGIERDAEYMKICEARLGVKADIQGEVVEQVVVAPVVAPVSNTCECGGIIKKIDGGRCCESCLKDYLIT